MGGKPGSAGNAGSTQSEVDSATGVALRILAERLVEAWDSDHDGRLSLSELPPELHNTFDRVDLDHDGTITPEELSVVLYSSPTVMTAYSFFCSADTDGNGRCDVTELTNLVIREGVWQQKLDSKESIPAAVSDWLDGRSDVDFGEFFMLLAKMRSWLLVAAWREGVEEEFRLRHDAVLMRHVCCLSDHVTLVQKAPVCVNPHLYTRPASKRSKAIHHLVTGAVAGVCAKTLIAPMDRLKILFQTSQRAFSIAAAVQLGGSVVRENGVMALWKGNSATALRVAPAAAMNFASHEALVSAARQFIAPGETLTITQKWGIGCTTGLITSLCTYPLDLVRVRMAVATNADASILGTFRSIAKEGRGLRGFYRGLVPTLIGIMPYSGTTWMLLDTLQPFVNASFRDFGVSLGLPPGNDDSRRVPVRLVTGAFSGLGGQFITYPLEMVRRRVQVSSGNISMADAADITRQLFAEGGVRGFWKGFTLNLLKSPIATATSFTIFTELQRISRDGNE